MRAGSTERRQAAAGPGIGSQVSDQETAGGLRRQGGEGRSLGAHAYLLAAIVVVGSLAVGVWLFSVWERGAVIKVPFSHNDAWGWADEQAEIGRSYVDGMVSFEVEGEDTLTITEVNPILEGGGMEHVGSWIAGPDRSSVGILNEIRPVPPEGSIWGDYVPAEGAVLEPLDQAADHPYDHWILLMGFEVVSAEPTVRTGVEIVYKSGWRTRTVYFPSGMSVCVETVSECPDSLDRMRGGSR